MSTLSTLLTGTEVKIVTTLAIILFLALLRVVLHKIVNSRVEEVRNRYIWRQSISYFILGVGLILLVRLWFEWVQSILTLLSLIAAAITIVSKELILNFIAYGIIIWRGLFNPGDRIQGAKISLTLRYLCKFHDRRTVENEVWEEILTRFGQEEDIMYTANQSPG